MSSKDLEKSKTETTKVHEHVHGPNCNHQAEPITRKSPKIGRNDPCSCGSQKKYKKCCGK